MSDHLNPADVFVRRTVVKRSHGLPGKFVDLQYNQCGLFLPITSGGGQDAMGVAVEIAIRQHEAKARIQRNGADTYHI
jgi:hypothetical protein